MKTEINIMVGGEIGQSVQSVGMLFAKSLVRWGYHVFADQNYESRARGGHNYFRIRAASSPVQAIAEAIDILIALNKEILQLHGQEMGNCGAIIYDGEKINGWHSHNLLNVPAKRLAKAISGDVSMTNTVTLGAALGLIGYDFELLKELLIEFFKTDDAKNNVKAARAGYEYVIEKFSHYLQKKLVKVSETKRMLLNGDEVYIVSENKSMRAVICPTL